MNHVDVLIVLLGSGFVGALIVLVYVQAGYVRRLRRLVAYYQRRDSW